MLFSSITFIYYFLPIALGLYLITPKKYRNLVLLITSLIFYFSGEPIYTLLLVFSSISDYLHSLYIEKHRGTKYAKRALVSSIIINLSALAFFKYIDFLIVLLNSFSGLKLALLNVPLPIGISFFTFQTMSYTIDVYRGDVKADKSIIGLATFVCLFPQLIAGPIVRYTDIATELQSRVLSWDQTAIGVKRFIIGLSKKVLLANSFGQLCVIFREVPDKSVVFYWMYGIAFTLQIYFDFSGYSDMAIGMGKMLGFNFPENFNYPYISKSITEFWRRWHITLSRWFRDYVYIPMGGNRVSKWSWVRNILTVWLLTGFWHGAAWNFILWGGYFGVLLILEKVFLGKILTRVGRWIPHMYVMLLVTISFVIFNADNLNQAFSDLSGMFLATGEYHQELPIFNSVTLYYLKSYFILFVIAGIAATPLPKIIYTKLLERLFILEPIMVLILLSINTASLVSGSFNPFLYFRF